MSLKTVIYFLLITGKIFSQSTFLYSDTLVQTGQAHVSYYTRAMSAVGPGFKTDNQKLIDSITVFLKKNQDITISIEVHTGTMGSDKMHLELSRIIGSALSDQLKYSEIRDEQYKIVPKGEKNPMYTETVIEQIKDMNKKIELDNKNHRFVLTVISKPGVH